MSNLLAIGDVRCAKNELLAMCDELNGQLLLAHISLMANCPWRIASEGGL